MDRVIAVWIFAGIEQQLHDFNVAELRCQSERTMAILIVGMGKQSTEVFDASESCRDGKSHGSAALDERMHGLKFAVSYRRKHRTVWIGSMIAEQLNQGNLDAALARNTAGGNEPERFVDCGLSCIGIQFDIQAGIENDLGEGDYVGGQSAVADWIFGDELQQRRVAKVISAFKDYVLPHQVGVLAQVGTQACNIACIEQVDGVAKDGVLDAFVVRQVESIGAGGLLNVRFEPGPAREAVFAGDGELRAAELELGSKDGGVCGALKTGMEFADQLRSTLAAGGMGFDQVFGLMLKLVEAGMGREGSDRHDELPFVGPGSAYSRAESQFAKRIVLARWTLSFPRTGCALVR